jgi:GINS complex subunit 2
LAGDTPIRIVPLFTLKDPLDFLSIQEGALDPFTAGIDMDCPMWLALCLQQRHLCRILLPSWLTVSNLQQVLQQEKTQGTFCHQIQSVAYEEDEAFDNTTNDGNHRGLPFRYLEIAQALLLNNKITAATMSSNDAMGGGGGDNSDRNLEAMRILLQDICQVRLDKIRTNLHTISQQSASTFKAVSTSSSWNEDEASNAMPLVNVKGIAAVEVAYYQPVIQQLFHDHDVLCQTTTTTSSAAGNETTEKENGLSGKTTSGEEQDNQGGGSSSLRSRLRRMR